MDRIITKKQHFLHRYWKVLTIFGALIVVACILAFGFEGKKLKVDIEKLSIFTVEYNQFREYIAVDGIVQPVRSIYLDAIEGGRIEQRLSDNGEFLNVGDTILIMSNSQLELEVIQREEQLFNEKQAYWNAVYNKDRNILQLKEQILEIELQLLRAQRTFSQDSALAKFVSKNELLKSGEELQHLQNRLRLLKIRLGNEEKNGSAQVRQYEQGIQLKERNLMLVKGNLDKLVVKAPVSGQLTALKGDVGEYKNRGENLGQIDVTEGFKVQVSIDEFYISRIATGQMAEFDFNGSTYTLQITRVNPEVTAGKFTADLEFKEELPTAIRRGQSLQVRMQLGTNEEKLLVKRGPFYNSTGGSWVYVLNSHGNEAQKRNIRVGRQNPEYFEILDGLKEGEKVIVSTYQNFGNADKLILK